MIGLAGFPNNRGPPTRAGDNGERLGEPSLPWYDAGWEPPGAGGTPALPGRRPGGRAREPVYWVAVAGRRRRRAGRPRSRGGGPGSDLPPRAFNCTRVPVSKAFACNGISPRTGFNWTAAHPEFTLAVAAARVHYLRRWLPVI